MSEEEFNFAELPSRTEHWLGIRVCRPLDDAMNLAVAGGTPAEVDRLITNAENKLSRFIQTNPYAENYEKLILRLYDNIDSARNYVKEFLGGQTA